MVGDPSRRLRLRRRSLLLGGLGALLLGRRARADAAVVAFIEGRPSPVLAGLLDGLRELGHLEGQTIVIERYAADGDPALLASLAVKALRAGPRLIVANTWFAAGAAAQATSKIPIVFTALRDPIEAGWTASVARPGTNLTGVFAPNVELTGKRLELLKDLVPGLTRVGVLTSSANAQHAFVLREAVEAGGKLGIAAVGFELTESARAEEVLTAIAVATEALVVPSFSGFSTQPLMGEIVRLARDLRLPAIFAESDWTLAGGLVTYAPSAHHMGKRAAFYVDRILKGASPADLPVEEARIDLTLNFATARAIGLAVPRPFLARADEIIE